MWRIQQKLRSECDVNEESDTGSGRARRKTERMAKRPRENETTWKGLRISNHSLQQNQATVTRILKPSISFTATP